MKRQAVTPSALRWLYRIKTKSKFMIMILVFLQTFLSIIGLGRILVLRSTIDYAVDGKAVPFERGIILIILLIVLQIISRAALRFCDEYVRSDMENCLKARLFSMLLKRDYPAVSSVHSGDWMTRLTADTANVSDAMVSILPGITGLIVQLSGAVVVLLSLDWRFGLLLLLGSPLFFFTLILRKKLKTSYQEIQEADAHLRIFMQERISNMLIIRSFSQENATENQSVLNMKRHQEKRLKRAQLLVICNAGFSVAMNGLYILGIAYGGYGILKGILSYGTFTAILQLILQLQMPLGNLSSYFPRYYSMIASAERLMAVEEFEDQQPICHREWKEIGLRDAGFTYNSQEDGQKKTISCLNFSVKKGEQVAFVGPSGCGKSTVLKLLMCLYPLDSGVCYLYTESGQKELHAMPKDLFAYVPQGNQLISGTIREIVTFADPIAMQQDERIWETLRIACADTSVKQLGKGLDEVLGERGAGLSEGQIQRIAIARAIFSENPILLLDEATSSLDEKTEAELLRNLRSLTDRTVIAVTHRPAVLDLVDKIVDFEHLEG